MVGFKSFALALVALTSVVSATFEPLAEVDSTALFARNGFSDLSSHSASDVYRRNQFSHKRSSKTNSATSATQYGAQISELLVDLQTEVTSFHSTISSACSKGFKGQSTTTIVQNIQPHLADCKQKVNECGHQISQCGNPGSKPSGGSWGNGGGSGGSGGGAPGCSGQIVAIIAEILEAIELLEAAIVEDEVALELLLGYCSGFNDSFTTLIAEADKLLDEVDEYTAKYLSAYSSKLEKYGFEFVKYL